MRERKKIIKIKISHNFLICSEHKIKTKIKFLIDTAIFEPEIEQCEPSSQTTFEYYLNFMSREIIKGNSIIIELIVNFGDIYDKSINKLQTKDLNRFNTKVQKALSEIKIFLFEPLDELINYFYSSAIENIVVEILRMKKTFIRFFKQNLIHFLAFKETPKIFEQINKLCSKSTSFIRKKKLPTKLRSIKAASLLKDCILDEESITMIENEQKFNKIINYLRQLKTIKTPYEKLNHINYLNKKIVKILDRLIKHHRISYEVEGKISLMSYLLVKSEYVEINSDIEFLQMFYDDDMKDMYEEFDTVYHYEILFSTLKLLQQ